MSTKILLLLALCCLASLVSVLADESVSKKNISLFNYWLEGTVDSNDLEENLTAIDELESKSKFPAIDSAVASIRKSLAADQCDEELLVQLESISTVFDVSTRIGRLVAAKLEPLLKTCGPVLERVFESEQSKLERPFVGPLLKRFSADNRIYFFGRDHTEAKYVDYLARRSRQPRHQTDQMIIDMIYHDAEQLYDGVGKFKVVERKRGGKLVQTNYPETFKNAFNKYLAAPCAHYTKQMAAVFEPIFAIDALKHPLAVEVLAPRTDQFKSGLFVYKRCLLIQNLSERTFKIMMDNGLRNY